MKAASSRAPLAGWLAIAALVIVADQVTKVAVDKLFAYGERLPLLPVLDLTLLYNRGAAFSFLAGADGWQRWFFTILALAVSGLLVWLLSRHGRQRMFSWALTLILGGALGNVIDRFIHGHVIDFVLVYYGDWFFPAFNLADTAITIGAALLILDEIRKKPRAAH